jgi:membrane associated rhomboid family serine protease
MNNYSPSGFKLMPPVVKNLLIINGLMFFASILAESKFGIDLNKMLGLYSPMSNQFRPYQLVSHLFMHANLTHIFSNMFALWMFGSAIENMWGSKRFFIYYLFTGIGAASLHLLVNYYEYQTLTSHMQPELVQMVLKQGAEIINGFQNYADPDAGKLNLLLNTPTVGASGAVFGILLAFGMLFPNSMIYLYFFFPMKAKYFVLLYGLFELYSGVVNQPGDNVAHFAHIGGMIFGFILIKYWKKNQFRRLN